MKNRKRILILVVLATFLLTGCSSRREYLKPEFIDSRFEYVGDLDTIDIPVYDDAPIYQIRDTETGANYIYLAGHYRASICPMYDADGQVVVTN